MPDGGSLCLPLPAVSAHRTDSIRNLGEVVVKAKTYKEVIPAQTLKGGRTAEAEQLFRG